MQNLRGLPDLTEQSRALPDTPNVAQNSNCRLPAASNAPGTGLCHGHVTRASVVDRLGPSIIARQPRTEMSTRAQSNDVQPALRARLARLWPNPHCSHTKPRCIARKGHYGPPRPTFAPDCSLLSVDRIQQLAGRRRKLDLEIQHRVIGEVCHPPRSLRRRELRPPSNVDGRPIELREGEVTGCDHVIKVRIG